MDKKISFFVSESEQKQTLIAWLSYHGKNKEDPPYQVKNNSKQEKDLFNTQLLAIPWTKQQNNQP